MKDLVLKNRYTLLLTVILAYVILIVVEGAITDRQPDWLLFDNSLFTLDLRDIEELSNLDFDLNADL